MKKMILVSAVMLMSLGVARAEGKGGMFLEPMVTYESGTGDIKFPAPINAVDSKVKGFGVGARFGIQAWDIVFVGVDGRYSIPKLTDSTLNQDVKTKAWNLGPLVGVQMPSIVGLRFWGSWILAGQLDPDKDKGVDEKFKSGKGFRVGAGFRVAMVSLNAEYQDIKYSESVIEEVGVFTPGYNAGGVELHNKSIILSVSIPIGI